MKNLFLLVVLVATLGFSNVVHAQLVAPVDPTGFATLSWDANLEADLAGYRIYQSTVSGVFKAPPITELRLPIVGSPAFNVSGLRDGTTYFWAVTAYDTAGNESDFSLQVTKTISIPPGAPKNFTVTITIVFPIKPSTTP